MLHSKKAYDQPWSSVRSRYILQSLLNVSKLQAGYCRDIVAVHLTTRGPQKTMCNGMYKVEMRPTSSRDVDLGPIQFLFAFDAYFVRKD